MIDGLWLIRAIDDRRQQKRSDSNDLKLKACTRWADLTFRDKHLFARITPSSERIWMKWHLLLVQLGQKNNSLFTVPSPTSGQNGRYTHQQKPKGPVNERCGLSQVTFGRTLLSPKGNCRHSAHAWIWRTNNNALISCYWHEQNRPNKLHSNGCWLGCSLTVHAPLAYSEPRSAWAPALETESSYTGRAVQENEVLPGLRTAFTKEGSCIRVSETLYTYILKVSRSKIYTCASRSVLPCCSETWPLTGDIRRISVCEPRCFVVFAENDVSNSKVICKGLIFRFCYLKRAVSLVIGPCCACPQNNCLIEEVMVGRWPVDYLASGMQSLASRLSPVGMVIQRNSPNRWIITQSGKA